MNSPTSSTPPLQPLLSDAVIAFRAPTQVWSGRDGEIGAAPIDGIYHGDVRAHSRSFPEAAAAMDYDTVRPSTVVTMVEGS